MGRADSNGSTPMITPATSARIADPAAMLTQTPSNGGESVDTRRGSATGMRLRESLTSGMQRIRLIKSPTIVSRHEPVADAIVRRDALLSGPLHGPCMVLSDQTLTDQCSTIRQDLPVLGATGDGDLERELSFRPLEETEFGAEEVGDKPKVQFQSCFMRVLRPSFSQWGSDAKVEVACITYSYCGSLLLAGGTAKLSAPPGNPAKDSGMYGWVAVWQRMNDLSWKQWPSGIGRTYKGVKTMSLLGNTLVVGHSYTPVITAAAYYRGLARSGRGAGGSGGVSSTPEGDVTVWELQLSDGTLKAQEVDKRGNITDTKGVTSVVWLTQPQVPLTERPEDGIFCATASLDGIITLWRYERAIDVGAPNVLTFIEESMQPIESGISQKKGKISDIAFLSRLNSEDNDLLLASASIDLAAIIWQFCPDGPTPEDRPRFAFKKKLPHPREVRSIAFRQTLGTGSAGDADLALTSCMDYNLRLWDVDNGVVIRTISNMTAHYTKCTFSHHGSLMLSGCQGGSLLVFDTYTGMKLKQITGHTADVTDVSVLPATDGLLATSSMDGSVRVWELKSSDKAIVAQGNSDKSTLSTTYTLAFTRGNTCIVSGHRDGSLRMWRLVDGLPVSENTAMMKEHNLFVFHVAVHPTDPICASACHDGSIRIWDLESGGCTQIIDNSTQNTNKEFSSVAFHPSGNWLIASSFDRRLLLFARKNQQASSLHVLVPDWRQVASWKDHTNRIWKVAFSQDGEWVASAAWDGRALVYSFADMEEHAKQRILEEGPDAVLQEDVPASQTWYHTLNCNANVWSVEFRPRQEGDDPDYSLLATGSTDSLLRVWYIRSSGCDTWEVLASLAGHRDTVTDLTWHPRGEMIVSTSFDKTVRLWARSKDKKFESRGIWASYSCPTMSVRWSYQNPADEEGSGTVIAVATFTGVTYVMDATDAGQDFVPFSRAQHVLECAGSGAVSTMKDIFLNYPTTLTSLGPADSGMLVLWGIINKSADKVMLPFLLDSARDFKVSPLLPYSPQNIAIITRNDYQLVSLIVDIILQMHEAGDQMNAQLLSTGYGTLSILQLIKNFPDQAVVLLNYFGMTPANEIVYSSGWNPHQKLVDGVCTFEKDDPAVTETRAPKELWKEAKKGKGAVWMGWSDDKVHTIAGYLTFPHIVGVPLDEWHGLRSGTAAFASEGKQTKFNKLENSFLHVAYNSGEPLLFDTAIGRAIIQWKWHAYGRWFYTGQTLFYLAHLVAMSAQAIQWGTLYRMGDCDIESDDGGISSDVVCATVPHETTALFSGSAIIVLTCTHFIYEFYQMWLLGLKYFHKFGRSFWHAYDYVMMPLLLAAGITGVLAAAPPQNEDGNPAAKACVFHDSTPTAEVARYCTALELLPVLTSLATFMTWMKFLYFMRAFSSTGGLVRLIAEITFEMRYMLMLVGIGIVSATIAFFSLPPHKYFADDGLQGSLDNLFEMFFFTFSVMMASYEVPSITDWLTKAFAMVFLFFQAIILLNALIALMSDTTEKIKENIKVIALRERAGLLLEMELVLGRNFMRKRKFRPRWLHALVEDDDIKVVNEANLESSSGPMTKADLNSAMESMSKMVDNKFKEMQEQLLDKVFNTMMRANSGEHGLTSRRASTSLPMKVITSAIAAAESEGRPSLRKSADGSKRTVAKPQEGQQYAPKPAEEAVEPISAAERWARLRVAFTKPSLVSVAMAAASVRRRKAQLEEDESGQKALQPSMMASIPEADMQMSPGSGYRTVGARMRRAHVTKGGN